MTRAPAFAVFVLGAVLLQGCAAIPVAAMVGVMGAVPGGDDAPADSDGAPAAALAASAPSPGRAGLPRLGALPPQDLPPGVCALFLFTRGAESRFVAFAPSDGAALTLALEDNTEILAAAAPLAESADGFAQTYRTADGMEARLTATLGDPLPQGRMAPAASLRLAASDGAAQVTPLSGLLACENPA